MSTDGTRDLTLRRERVNKHSVRYTARDCTESATAPCPTVTLPTALVGELGLGEADDLLVRVYATDRAQAPASELPVYGQLLREVDPSLAEALTAEELTHERARQRGERLAALTGVGYPPGRAESPTESLDAVERVGEVASERGVEEPGTSLDS